MKLVSAFYGDSSTYLDNTWANSFDNFFYGSSGTEENEDNGVWQGSDFKNYKEQLHNSFGTTNLNDINTVKDATENIISKNDSIPVPSPLVFDVIFENSNQVNSSNISIGKTGLETNQSINSSESTSKEDKNEGERYDQKLPESNDLQYKFLNLDLNCFENCVSCNYVDGVQSARALFLFTHSWLKKSKLFYTIKDHPMEYVNVILDLSELYRYLAFYEDEIEK